MIQQVPISATASFRVTGANPEVAPFKLSHPSFLVARSLIGPIGPAEELVITIEPPCAARKFVVAVQTDRATSL